MNFAEFLKKYSTIDNKFIDDYLDIYYINNNDIFIVNLVKH